MKTAVQTAALFLLCLLVPPLTTAQGLTNSHVEANVPVGPDFRKFLLRDLEAYFASVTGRRVRTEYELLRDAPTQSGVAYPKFYAWVRLFAGETLVDEGAVRVAAIDRVRFEVTDYVSRSRIAREPRSVEPIFPPPLLPAIRARAEATQ